MVATSIALLVGVLLVQWLPWLPGGWWLAASVSALTMLAMLLWRWPRSRLLAWFVLGVAWAVWRGAQAFDARLPRALEGQDLVVVGQVEGLPERRPDATRFRLRVTSAMLDGQPQALRGRVKLAWYDHAPRLVPCTTWRLRLRLKRPRAMLDPGGADSERSALQRGIVAVGYVRPDTRNHPLRQASWCVDRIRAALADGIRSRVDDRHDAALLKAFSVGDTRDLREHDWAVARANGVSHLIAISGFHVGVAAAFGVWLMALLYGLFPSFALRLPRVQAQAAAALVTAFGYGALAGMGLPTVRTLLMISVVAVARCTRRQVRGVEGLALAMLAMLLVDPLAVLSAGFWLSFVGVAFLMLCLSTRWRGLRGFVRELGTGQLVMTIALLPLTLWFFGQASLVGALSNLVAVPVVSFLIVPLALFGMLALLLWPPAAWPFLWAAAHVAHAQWWMLERVAGWSHAQWYLPQVRPVALALAMLGGLWLLAPRGVPSRWLGALLFLPLLVPRPVLPPSHGFEAWVLDVGQGLSVIVRTRRHVLLYDTGARYPSGFDLGAAVVVPSLHALGVRRLDMLMVSHGDNDHAGGAGAVIASYPRESRLAGEPARMAWPMARCAKGQSWIWDGVRFSVLGPEDHEGSANDRSCVLLIDGGADRLLMPGDITHRVEPRVAAAVRSGRPVLMLVPHHGSNTSSSKAFIDALHPSLAVVSAGWRNRFGHPRPRVVGRYARAGVPLLNTATSGAIRLEFPPVGHARVARRERLDQRRYWRE